MEFLHIQILMAIVLGTLAISLFISVLTNQNLKLCDSNEEEEAHDQKEESTEKDDHSKNEDQEQGVIPPLEAVFAYRKKPEYKTKKNGQIFFF